MTKYSKKIAARAAGGEKTAKNGSREKNRTAASDDEYAEHVQNGGYENDD